MISTSTIAALSTAYGKSAIGIIRVSGTNVPNIIKVLPDVEGPLTETHFVYPQSLKNVAKIKAFRNFLFSKISEWKF